MPLLPPAPNAPDFDDDAIREVLALDPDGTSGLARTLVEAFREDARAKLLGLRARIADGDAAGIHALTHPLKSSAASLGLARVARLSQEIDDDARRGGLSRATALIDTLAGAIDAGVAWLEARTGIAR